MAVFNKPAKPPNASYAEKLAAKAFEKRLNSITPPAPEDPLPPREGKPIDEADKAEWQAMDVAIRRAKSEVKLIGDAAFYTTIVFADSAQRDAFLAAVGWTSLHNGRYIDGAQVAKAMGVSLPESRLTGIRPAKPDKKCLAVGIIPQE